MEIINNETGEIITIEDKNEVIKKEFNALVPDEVIEDLYQLQAIQERLEIYKAKYKEAFLKLFKENNIKSFKNDYIRVTYVAPSVRKSVDTKKLKDCGLYDQFTKESEVKESLRIEVIE